MIGSSTVSSPSASASSSPRSEEESPTSRSGRRRQRTWSGPSARTQMPATTLESIPPGDARPPRHDARGPDRVGRAALDRSRHAAASKSGSGPFRPGAHDCASFPDIEAAHTAAAPGVRVPCPPWALPMAPAPPRTLRIGGDLEVNRLGFGAMRLTGAASGESPPIRTSARGPAASAGAGRKPDRHGRLLRAGRERVLDRRGPPPLSERARDRHEGRAHPRGPQPLGARMAARSICERRARAA